MSRLLFFHDFTSPFCRLAAPVAAEAATRTGLTLRPVPYELRPAPAPLPDPAELADELSTAETVAREWGVPLGELTVLPRTRKAHEAVAFAVAEDAGPALLAGLYDALWAEGRDLSRLDVLTEIAAGCGLDPEPLHVALGLDEHGPTVVREQEAAVAAGIEGVPAVQLRDVVAIGLLPLPELVEWIEAHR